MSTGRSCVVCRHFAPLRVPFHYEALGYPEGVTVYGICCKDCKSHHFYPVYVAGNACRNFQKKPREKIPEGPVDGQLRMEV